MDSGFGHENTKIRASSTTGENIPSRGFIVAKEEDFVGIGFEGSGVDGNGLDSQSQQQQSLSQLQQQLKPQPPSELAFVLSTLETQHQNESWNAHGQGLRPAPGPELDLFTSSPTARMTATMSGFSPRTKGPGVTGPVTGNLMIDSIGNNDNSNGSGLLARAKRSLSHSRSNTFAQTESMTTTTTSTTKAITTTTTPLTVVTHATNRDSTHHPPSSSTQHTPTTPSSSSSAGQQQHGAFSLSPVHRSGGGSAPLEDSSYTRTLLTITFPNNGIVASSATASSSASTPVPATGPIPVNKHNSHTDKNQSPAQHPNPSPGSRTVHARTVHAFAFTHNNHINPIPGLSTGSNRERCGDEVTGVVEGSGGVVVGSGVVGSDNAMTVAHPHPHPHPYDDEDGLLVGGLVDLRKVQPRCVMLLRHPFDLSTYPPPS